MPIPLFCNVAEGAKSQYQWTLIPEKVDFSRADEHIKLEKKFADCKVAGFTAFYPGLCPVHPCVCHGDTYDKDGNIVRFAYLAKVLTPVAFMRHYLPTDKQVCLNHGYHGFHINVTAEARIHYHKMVAEACTRCHEDIGVHELFDTGHKMNPEDLEVFSLVEGWLDQEIKKIAAADQAAQNTSKTLDAATQTESQSDASTTKDDNTSSSTAQDLPRPTHTDTNQGSTVVVFVRSTDAPNLADVITSSIAARSPVQKHIAAAPKGTTRPAGSTGTRSIRFRAATQTEDRPDTKTPAAAADCKPETYAKAPTTANVHEQKVPTDPMAQISISSSDSTKASAGDDKFKAHKCSKVNESAVVDTNAAVGEIAQQNPKSKGWGSWLSLGGLL